MNASVSVLGTLIKTKMKLFAYDFCVLLAKVGCIYISTSCASFQNV